ncbi:MAG: hypothetical protein J6N49_04285 [Alphaproteobacteria bacterium]|nr:hypothetical protein [Alphaproteobacteria bacterium]
MNSSNFNSIDDFKNFVQKLTSDEIKSWSTYDWLGVYVEIEKLRIAQNPCISCKDFVNEVCKEEFKKLYQNYRFDADEFQIVRKMARKVGEDLAEQGRIDLAEILHNSEQACPQMKAVVDTVQKISQMPHEISLETIGKSSSTDSLGWANYHCIALATSRLKDQVLQVTAHEAAHALLQHDSSGQISLKDDFTKRELCHSDAFSLLMGYNRRYYLRVEGNHEYFNGYENQPIEKHANFFGYFCERRFREKSGQLTERCAIKLLQTLDKPLKAYYEEKDIVMEYASDDLQKIKALSEISPKECLQCEEKNGIIRLKIKSSYRLSNFLNKLQMRKVEIGKDLSIQQYLDYPFLSRYISIPQNVELPEKTDFSRHPSVRLRNANCDNCTEIILPQVKSVDEWYWSKVSNTVLPERLNCSDGNVVFQNCDFSKVKEIVAHKSVLAIKESVFPSAFDFSGMNSIKFKDVDLSNLESVQWPHKITSLEGCKLPESVDFSNVKSVNLCGADLSKTRNIKLPDNLDNVVISREMLIKYPALKTAITIVREMKKMKDCSAKRTGNKSKSRQCQYTQNVQRTL